jgi:hypothetical protein
LVSKLNVVLDKYAHSKLCIQTSLGFERCSLEMPMLHIADKSAPPPELLQVMKTGENPERLHDLLGTIFDPTPSDILQLYKIYISLIGHAGITSTLHIPIGSPDLDAMVDGYEPYCQRFGVDHRCTPGLLLSYFAIGWRQLVVVTDTKPTIHEVVIATLLKKVDFHIASSISSNRSKI